MKTQTLGLGFGLVLGLTAALPVLAGNERLMVEEMARTAAVRGLVESVHGVKVRTTSEVKDLVHGIFDASAETKTVGTLSGHDPVVVKYDEATGVAKATATITLKNVKEFAGMAFPNPDKKIQRIGFSTVRPEMKPAILALRAAEIDAYAKLAEQIFGMEVEGKSTVRNMVLQSDSIKSKVVAALFMAEMKDPDGYGWNKDGDAHITLLINVDEVAKIIGEKLNVTGMVEATGNGAAIDDYKGGELPRVEVKKEEPMPPALPAGKKP